MPTLAALEAERVAEQVRLDAERTALDRNRAGQFATPPDLAADILAGVLPYLPAGEPVRFLDPGVGSGAFVSALLARPPAAGIGGLVGVEQDPRFAALAARLWGPAGLRVLAADFTAAPPVGQHNLLVANPPYVRHHHLDRDNKRRLQQLASAVAGVPVSGLAGLYVHFLLLADAWLAPGGVAAWLIPAEFLDVNYGRAVRHYLTRNVDLLRVHRFAAAAVQFRDALVSSAVVVYRKTAPGRAPVAFTTGASFARPENTRGLGRDELDPGAKWGRTMTPTEPSHRLGDLFVIRRGLATGCNEFFIRPRAEAAARRLPAQFLRPILPSPRHVRGDVIDATSDGTPRLASDLVLIDCRLPEREVAASYPTLWAYFEEGVRAGIPSGYLCSRRTPWYAQEDRPPAPFVVPYMGRGRAGGSPFRFILNRSRATTANVYLLLYPRGPWAARLLTDSDGLAAVHTALQEITGSVLAAGGRVYGGGLQKVEPNELAAIPAGKLLQVMGVSGSRNLFDSLA